MIEEKQLIPDHQFRFLNQYFTMDQVHRITNVIEKSLEEKKICSATFPDVTQTFDKICMKVRTISSITFFLPYIRKYRNPIYSNGASESNQNLSILIWGKSKQLCHSVVYWNQSFVSCTQVICLYSTKILLVHLSMTRRFYSLETTIPIQLKS